jgi:alkanesulfonate monooxygenase SsuD/methylene tetrahydromethanopterin reductase-like flavin-dependent oxidoreductase (luciferase family)
LQFGLTFVPVFPLGYPAAQAAREILEQAKWAQKSGFNALWAAQHRVNATEQMFQPFPLLARLSGECPGMWLGTSTFLLAFAHPIDVAEQAANLDILSGGRFTLGVSLGYRDEEYRAFEVPKAQGVGRLREGIAIVRQLWTEDQMSFHGRHFHLDGVSIQPKPLQKPSPEIWLGADTEPGASRAGELGDGWIISPRQSRPHIRKLLARYREATRKRGAGEGQLLLVRELHLAPTREQALNEARPFLQRMYETYVRWGQPGERYDVGFDELLRGRYIIGDPAGAIEELSVYTKELNVTQVSFRMTWPGMKSEDVVNSIRLLGDKVIPYFRSG